jgi:hypothetical protein
MSVSDCGLLGLISWVWFSGFSLTGYKPRSSHNRNLDRGGNLKFHATLFFPFPLCCIFILITEDSCLASTYPPLMRLAAASLCCNHSMPTCSKEERPSWELIVTPLVNKFHTFMRAKCSCVFPAARHWSHSLGRLIQYKQLYFFFRFNNIFWSAPMSPKLSFPFLFSDYNFASIDHPQFYSHTWRKWTTNEV